MKRDKTAHGDFGLVTAFEYNRQIEASVFVLQAVT